MGLDFVCKVTTFERGVDKLLAQIYFLILSHTEITENTESFYILSPTEMKEIKEMLRAV